MTINEYEDITTAEFLTTPVTEISSRIKRLQSKLNINGIDGVIIIQNVDLLYFTGTIAKAHLYIPAKGEPILLVGRNLIRIEKETPLKNIVSLDNPKNLIQVLEEAGIYLGEKIGLELDVIPANTYLFFKKILGNKQLVDVSGIIKQVRSVKSDYEINLMEQSANIMDKVYKKLPEIIKEGMSEIELAAQLECTARFYGHHGLIRTRNFNAELFYGHLLSGISGELASSFDSPTGGTGLSNGFSQGAGWKKIARNEPISLDYVGQVYGYHVDFTRLFVLGRLPDRLLEAFKCALAIQEKIINRLKPGTICCDLYELGLKLAEKAGLAQYFMGPPGNQVKFIGHGIGLEVDELPVLAKGFEIPLEEGMTIAIEPKFIFPGYGTVGIENTWVVTKNNPQKITKTPDDLCYIL